MQEILQKLEAVAEQHGAKPCELSPREAEKQLVYAKIDGANKVPGKLNEEWPDAAYDCNLCLNRGYVLEAHEQAGEVDIKAVLCRCMTVRKSMKRLARSGLKSVTRIYTFKKFETETDWQNRIKQTALSFTEQVLSGNKQWFFIGGQTGCGKTHICTAIAVQAIKNYMDVIYMTWRDDVRILKAAVNTPEYTARINALKSVDVLYIDDFLKGRSDNGRYSPTESDIGIAFELLNHRYNNQQTTIISSELTLDTIADIDEAIAGRIAQRSKGYCIAVQKDQKKNYRLKGVVNL